MFHAAGATQERTLESLAPGQLAAVIEARADTAWNVHELTGHLDLDAFVLFSSAAATLGGVGQAAACAANAFLDTLAGYRRRDGRTGIAVAWGAWAGRSWRPKPSGASGSGGMSPLDPARALAVLREAMARDDTDVMIADLDWARLAQAGWRWASGGLLAELAPSGQSPVGQSPGGQPFAGPPSAEAALVARLAAMGEREARAELLGLVRSQAAAVLATRTSPRWTPDAVSWSPASTR